MDEVQQLAKHQENKAEVAESMAKNHQERKQKYSVGTNTADEHANEFVDILMPSVIAQDLVATLRINASSEVKLRTFIGDHITSHIGFKLVRKHAAWGASRKN